MAKDNNKLSVTRVNKDFSTVAEMVHEYREIALTIKMLEAEQNRLKEVIIPDMYGADKKSYQYGKTTFEVRNTLVRSTRVDVAKVKAAFPDWEKRFGSTTENPRFTVK